MDSGEELELVKRNLLGLDSQFVVQLPLRGPLHPQNGSIQLRPSLPRNSQRVRAAGVRPHIRESDLLRRALLEEQPFAGIEQEDGKGAVEKASVDIGH